MPWYTERNLTDISLGGLLILVVIRTVQYNMMKMRDKYLHTNCLAALANMSGHFRHLHPYVSQRLVSLFETLAKKYHRLLLKLSEASSEDGVTVVPIVRDVADVEQDVCVLEEVIERTQKLEFVFISCLKFQLCHS